MWLEDFPLSTDVSQVEDDISDEASYLLLSNNASHYWVNFEQELERVDEMFVKLSKFVAGKISLNNRRCTRKLLSIGCVYNQGTGHSFVVTCKSGSKNESDVKADFALLQDTALKYLILLEELSDDVVTELASKSAVCC